jgi:hypothetical protein
MDLRYYHPLPFFYILSHWPGALSGSIYFYCVRYNITGGHVSTNYLSIYLYFYLSVCLQPLWTLAAFFNFLIYTQSVGLLGRVMNPSQGRYLHTEQHKNRINAQTDIHASSGIRTHDPSVRAGEDGSCSRPCGHCDRHVHTILPYKF